MLYSWRLESTLSERRKIEPVLVLAVFVFIDVINVVTLLKAVELSSHWRSGLTLMRNAT